MAYTKLWHKIVTSSIWDADKNTRLLWITMLALANRDGFVESSFKSLALLARLTEQECRGALAELESPDPDSRTKTDDGRRLHKVDGGWQIINYAMYREATNDDPHSTANRERQARYRALHNVTKRDAAYASASASAVTVTDRGPGDGVAHANYVALTAWVMAEYKRNRMEEYEKSAAYTLARRPDFPAELSRVRAWKAKCDKEGLLFKKSIRSVLDGWQDLVDQSIVMVKEQADAEAYRKHRAEIQAKLERGEIVEDRNG
jgi:hypothetical protein